METTQPLTPSSLLQLGFLTAAFARFPRGAWFTVVVTGVCCAIFYLWHRGRVALNSAIRWWFCSVGPLCAVKNSDVFSQRSARRYCRVASQTPGDQDSLPLLFALTRQRPLPELAACLKLLLLLHSAPCRYSHADDDICHSIQIAALSCGDYINSIRARSVRASQQEVLDRDYCPWCLAFGRHTGESECSHHRV
jgi:hypothetical protein